MMGVSFLPTTGSSLGLLSSWHKPETPSADFRDLSSEYSAFRTSMVSRQAPSVDLRNLFQSSVIPTDLASTQALAFPAYPESLLSQSSAIPRLVGSKEALVPRSAYPGNFLYHSSATPTNMVLKEAGAPSVYPGSLPQSSFFPRDTVPEQLPLAPSADLGNSSSQSSTIPTIRTRSSKYNSAQTSLVSTQAPSVDPRNLLSQSSATPLNMAATQAVGRSGSSSKYNTVPRNNVPGQLPLAPAAAIGNSRSQSSTGPSIMVSREALGNCFSQPGPIPVVLVPVSRQLPTPPSADSKDPSPQPSDAPVIMGQSASPVGPLDGLGLASTGLSGETGTPALSQTKRPQSTPQQAESVRGISPRPPSDKQLAMEHGRKTQAAPTSEGPLYCLECKPTAQFATHPSWKKHMIEMHKGRVFRCDMCKRGFQNAGSLRRHIKQMHMGQPSFRCFQCNQGFMFKDHYIGHMNKHNNTPTFKCTNCPKMFIYKPDMYHHRKHCPGFATDPTRNRRRPNVSTVPTEAQRRPKNTPELPLQDLTKYTPILPKPSTSETSELQPETELQPEAPFQLRPEYHHPNHDKSHHPKIPTVKWS